MSHYSIWVEMLDKNYTEVIVFEDDLNIQPKFKERLSEVRNELDYMNWDFIFIGRQISKSILSFPSNYTKKHSKSIHLGIPNEAKVEGSKWLVHPKYSYWTLGYMLSESGAKKLIEENPLGKPYIIIVSAN